MIEFPSDVLIFDIESHSASEMYRWTPRDFFRLGGYAWGEDAPVLTDDYDEVIAAIRAARLVIGHNIHQFDLSVLFGVDSIEPLTMAYEGRVYDTFIDATMVNPAPEGVYTKRNGKQQKCTSPAQYRRWYSLDNQAFQLGTPGKAADLTELVDPYTWEMAPLLGPDGEPVRYKSGKKKGEVRTRKQKRTDICCGFGTIPLDDEDFRTYLIGDVQASREVARALLARAWSPEYVRWVIEGGGDQPYTYQGREQINAGIDAQITRNGWVVDQQRATERVKEAAEVAAHGLNELHDRFGLPLSGKMPLRSNAGKEALLKALESVGVREMDLERTANGAPSFGGDSVKKACGWKTDEHDEYTIRPEDGNPEALDLGDLVAILGGQRSLPELALSSTREDGRVHPNIWPGQRSGRKSTTNPGLTIWDDSHKEYFLPDSEDHVLIEIDASNADARAVAAESGDRAFAVRFEPGQDGHLLNAWAVWGREVVGDDKHNPTTAKYRKIAKPGGHAWGYRVGPGKLSKTLGIPFLEARAFLNALNSAYPGVVVWQNEITKFGEDNGFVVNGWGRIMPITGSAYTQGPALIGQSTTNEILKDGLMRMPIRILRMIKVTIHDALVLSMPKATLSRDLPFVIQLLSTSYRPAGGRGQAIEFPFEHGEPGRNWLEAIH